MTSKPQHVHPIALVFYLYKSIRSLIVPLVISIITIASDIDIPQIWLILLIVAIVLWILIDTLSDYFTFTYQLLDDEIIVKSGFFIKKVNHIPYDRIQNITTNQWFFLKPFALEALEIETAGQSNKAEVSLTAVPDSLRQRINSLRNNVQIEPEVAEPSSPSGNTYRISWSDLIKFALTSPAFLSGLLAVLAVYGKVEKAISKQMYQDVFNQAEHVGFLIMILLGFSVVLIFYIVSALVLIAQYYHFQLEEESGQFKMTRGLFRTRKTSISMDRVQAVVVKQPLLRSILGIATIQIVIVSNSKEGDTEKDIVVMPVIKADQVQKFLARFFPKVPVAQKSAFEPVKRTYYYYLRNASILAIITAVLIIWPLKSIVWLCVTLVILELLFWYLPAYLTARRSKVQSLNKDFMVLQNNNLMTKQVVYIPKATIQYVEKRKSLWLDKKQMSGLIVYLRSGNSKRAFKVNYQPESDIKAVVDWYKISESRL